jgi:hypothetical protein
VDAVPPPDRPPAGPPSLAGEEIARYVVAAAVWAPSVHNTQPWRFTASQQQISLHADAGRQLHVADPDGREMRISCGAASTCGAAAALHTQPLELGWLRESIRTGLSDGAYPQLVLRFGVVTQAAVSVRRPAEDVLSASGSEEISISDG